MRTRLARLIGVAASAAVLASALAGAPAALAKITFSQGQTQGINGCSFFFPTFPQEGAGEKYACEQWSIDVPPNALDWDFHDKRSTPYTTSTGVSTTANIEETSAIETTLDDDGEFAELHFESHFDASVENGMQAQGFMNYLLQLKTVAPKLTVTGTAHIESTGMSRYPAANPNSQVKAAGLSGFVVLISCGTTVGQATEQMIAGGDEPLE
ncbi:MAG TPA: hypothetical protein VIF63_06025, partial [Candidatus Limnocylindrales bacterium]